MYAVIVHASSEAQARDVVPQLVPLMELQAETLHVMCKRGFVTVESSLSEEEGAFLIARLRALGLPAELVPESELMRRVEFSSSPAPVSSPPPPTASRTRDDEDVPSVSLFDDGEWGELQEVVELSAMDGDEAATSKTEQQEKHAPSGGWGALFPDLESVPSTPAPRAPATTSSSPPPTRPPVTAPTRADEPALTFGAEPLQAPADIGFGSEPLVASPPEPKHAPRAHKDPLERVSAPPVSAQGGVPSRGPSFEGERILSALGLDEDEELPPHAPRGYDPRPPHSAEIARWLSIVAPGAGQVYNGDEHRSLDYGLKFFLIKPWIESVKDATRRGEKIATYWAPRPKEGNLLRTMKYMGSWYLTNAFILLIVVVVTGVVRDQLTKRSRGSVTLSPAAVSLAIKDAKLDLLAARVESLGAVGDAMEALQNERSKLDPEERLQRLFIRGVEDCQRGKFAMCEETMRRVNELSNNQHRDALRMQTWAAMRRQGGSSAPMPVLSIDVRTIKEYESEQEAGASEGVSPEEEAVDDREEQKESEVLPGQRDSGREDEIVAPREGVEQGTSGEE